MFISSIIPISGIVLSTWTGYRYIRRLRTFGNFKVLNNLGKSHVFCVKEVNELFHRRNHRLPFPHPSFHHRLSPSSRRRLYLSAFRESFRLCIESKSSTQQIQSCRRPERAFFSTWKHSEGRSNFFCRVVLAPISNFIDDNADDGSMGRNCICFWSEGYNQIPEGNIFFFLFTWKNRQKQTHW